MLIFHGSSKEYPNIVRVIFFVTKLATMFRILRPE